MKKPSFPSTPSKQPAADPAFEELCRLLSLPPRTRRLADYLEIGRIVHATRPQAVPGAKRIYRTNWMAGLIDRLAARGIRASESLLYKYVKFATFPDQAFLRACRRAFRAQFEDVAPLLEVADKRLRRELLTKTELRADEALSARTFKELVRLRAAKRAQAGGRIRASPRPTHRMTLKALRSAGARAARQATRWLDGPEAPADRLAAETGLDPIDASRVRATVRQFRAAANSLLTSLDRADAELARPLRPRG